MRAVSSTLLAHGGLPCPGPCPLAEAPLSSTYTDATLASVGPSVAQGLNSSYGHVQHLAIDCPLFKLAPQELEAKRDEPVIWAALDAMRPADKVCSVWGKGLAGAGSARRESLLGRCNVLRWPGVTCGRSYWAPHGETVGNSGNASATRVGAPQAGVAPWLRVLRTAHTGGLGRAAGTSSPWLALEDA